MGPWLFLGGVTVGTGATIYLSDSAKTAAKYAIAGGAIYMAGKMMKAW